MHACLLAGVMTNLPGVQGSLGFRPFTRLALQIPRPLVGKVCPGARVRGPTRSHHTIALLLELLLTGGCEQPARGPDGRAEEGWHCREPCGSQADVCWEGGGTKSQGSQPVDPSLGVSTSEDALPQAGVLGTGW